jgi:VanZ family protein
MPIPSLYKSEDPARAWNVIHAAAYGAVIGALAATFKSVGPFRVGAASLADALLEISGAVLAFALLCAAAAALRNIIARRLIWHDSR